MLTSFTHQLVCHESPTLNGWQSDEDLGSVRRGHDHQVSVGLKEGIPGQRGTWDSEEQGTPTQNTCLLWPEAFLYGEWGSIYSSYLPYDGAKTNSFRILIISQTYILVLYLAEAYINSRKTLSNSVQNVQ